MEEEIKKILEGIGENPDREGLKDTPKRVVKSFEKLYGGYKDDYKKHLTTFDAEGYDGVILLKDIELYSTCEHHMQIFEGKCHIAYVPNGKIIGVSKLIRIMEIFARRLQIQERLTKQIADALQEILNPLGLMVYIEAQHFCIRSRGVEKQNSVMVTSVLKGKFLTEPEMEMKILQMIKK